MRFVYRKVNVPSILGSFTEKAACSKYQIYRSSQIEASHLSIMWPFDKTCLLDAHDCHGIESHGFIFS